ncbi:MAG: hypothetical protein KGY41_10260, partial [Desulfovermiculus sp.]|nr:hypothetical protein [Desulfovermiculus sp.]
MTHKWLHTTDPKGWARWRRHALVLVITIGLNVLIFLTIPFLSQLREAEPENARLAGTPTVVNLQPNDPPQTDSLPNESPPEPEKPKELPQPDFKPQQVEFSPPTRPELPKLQIDMPKIDVGRIEISQPEEPEQVDSSPEPKTQPKQAESPPKPQPRVRKTEFSLSEVDSHPRLVRKVQPTYP